MLKRPKEKTFIDGTSPYAEYLPTRFRQYDPETGEYIKGESAVIPGGPSSIDADLLMEANFGRASIASKASRRSKNPSPAKVKDSFNFYEEKNNFLSPAGGSEFDRESGRGTHNIGEEINHDAPMFQKNYKVKPHQEDVKQRFDLMKEDDDVVEL